MEESSFQDESSSSFMRKPTSTRISGLSGKDSDDAPATRIISSRSANAKSKTATKTLEELNRLRFDRLDTLYGRDDEIEALHIAFNGLRKGTNGDLQMNMINIGGPSGTGKSAIVKEFQRQISKKNRSAIFVSGKFDQHQRSLPYTAFITALTQLVSEFSHIPVEDKVDLEQSALKKNYHSLLDLIPNLEDLFPDDRSNKDEESSVLPDQGGYDVMRSQARFKFALSTFLANMCRPKHKVIMFLDDLQWIDPASLDLLEFMLMEPGLEESLLIIGSYRDNEVDEQHAMVQRLTIVEKARGQQIKRMTIQNLTFENTHNLISDLFNTEPSYSKELAEIAYKKVEGNAFFLIQFLIALRDEGHLSFNIGTTSWSWDLERIRQSTVVSNNVLAVLMGKMKKLGDNARRMLTIMSFLGASFEETLIDIVATELADSKLLPSVATIQDTKVVLESLIETGFLELIQDRSKKRTYCFAHDQIQLAAISFQNEDSVAETNLEIARALYSNRFKFDFDRALHVLVDMYNEGKDLVKSWKEVSLLVDLNLQAGRHALEASAFAASARYLRQAIDLIPPEDRWDRHYHLFLEIQNMLMKAEFSNGEWDELHRDIETVVSAEGKPILDKITAYSLKLAELISRQNKHVQAINLAVGIMKELGVVFRLSLGKLAIVGGLVKTKKLVKKIPVDSVLSKGEMKDVNKAVVLDLFTTINSALYAANPDLMVVSTLKILRWSLKYGTCTHTCRCLGTFALIDFALGNMETANETCRLALKLAKQQNLMETQYVPITAVYGFVLPWSEPLSSCAKELLHGYEIGLSTGDLEFAFMNITLYGLFCFSIGKPLSNLEADYADYSKQMKEYNMELQLVFLCLTWQVILNLMGRNEDPLSMDGEAMTEQAMIDSAEQGNNRPLRTQLYCHKLQLCVYFDDFELGASFFPETKRIGIDMPANMIIWRTALFEGIVAFELLRRGIKKHKAVGMRALKNIEKFVSNKNVNCVHILYLLQAEKESSSGNIDQARALYDKSIVNAARSGFTIDKALANERCGTMLQREKDEYWAKHYLEQAKEAYIQIEAHGKVDHMAQSNKLLQPKFDLGQVGTPAEASFGNDATVETGSMSHSFRV